MTFQVEPRFYYKNYDTKERFCSYWHQIQEIVLLNPKSILEIGVGNGFVSKYLKQSGFDIITMDVDRRLSPDSAGSVLHIPFSDDAFDVVASYELLEHLPYENFEEAISEIFRVSRSCALLSLPDINRSYRLHVQIPRIGEFKKLISLRSLRKPVHHFDGQHHWEIGKAGYSLKTILDDIDKAGFKVERTYRVFEIPYHRFFILKKVSS